MADLSVLDMSPSLSRFCTMQLPDILSSVDAARLLTTVENIVAHDRWNSFDQFHETNRLLMGAYESRGAGAELYTIPTGGTRGSGKWIIPEAEDIHSATLDLIEPVGRRLLDYRQCPWHGTQWSDSTPAGGVTCELIAVDSAEAFSPMTPGSLTGKLILTRLSPQSVRAKLCAAGAVGVLCDQPIDGCPDAVPWTKFGWGGLEVGEPPASLIGLAISAAQGDELRALLRGHLRVIVHAEVDVRHYDGSHGMVSGLIRGHEDPDSEIWAVAHAAEPGALDNASGVAACVEIAGVLNALIAGGTLPPPLRTIRLLHGYECYSFFHFLEHTERLQPPLAGVCIDTIGARPDLCRGELRWHRTAPASASFVDDLGATFLQQALELRPIYQLKRMPFLSTEDTLLGDPHYGFPCPWITNHPATGYHSSCDTLDKIDAQGLAVCTAAMAGYLYYLANIATEEALAIGRRHTTRTLAQIDKSDKYLPAQTQSLRQQHNASIDRLRRFVWTGDHAQLTAEFDEMVSRVAEPARQRDVAREGDNSSYSLSPAYRGEGAKLTEVRPYTPVGRRGGHCAPGWSGERAPHPPARGTYPDSSASAGSHARKRAA